MGVGVGKTLVHRVLITNFGRGEGRLQVKFKVVQFLRLSFLLQKKKHVIVHFIIDIIINDCNFVVFHL